MNLPNALSALRIAAAPFLLLLPFVPSGAMRLLAFVLYVLAWLTDYWDGVVARSRSLVTDLGRTLDPLADKFLLVATILPVYLLMQPRAHWLSRTFNVDPDTRAYPFVTPLGEFDLPLWIVITVLAREVVMTVFRFVGTRRGVVISAIPSAKAKTTLQAIWIGTAYFWFFAATAATELNWTGALWTLSANVVGVVGMLMMLGAVTLTLYSLAVYVRRYGIILGRQTAAR